MWNKQQNEGPGSSAAQGSGSPVATFNPTQATRSSSSSMRTPACLGSSLQIKGQITGTEDLQIDGKVEGPISLNGHGLTIGATAQVNSEVDAREVIVSGRVVGNLRARDRVDIKKDGSVIGDITTARISIEDGAHFKGRIEIVPGKSQASASTESSSLSVATKAN